MDTRQYWYGIDGERLGPVSLAELHGMVREGRLRPTDYIWNEEHRVWTRVTDFLSGIGESSAPPPPTGGPGFGEAPADGPSPEDADFSSQAPGQDWGAAAGQRYGGAFVDQNAGHGYADAAEPREYAGFWLRLGAHIIDSFILGAAGLIWFVIAMMLGWMDSFLALESAMEPLDFTGYWDALPWSFWMGGFLIQWIYDAGFIASRWMATPGKRLMGVAVVNDSGTRCSFGQATLRTVMKIIFAQMTGGLAYLVIAFTEKKQGIHDLIAQTYCEKL